MNGTLKGRTLFVSGGSRGIGLAIARRAGRDGANVIIAAKTDRPNPKLPGTIHSAAEEIEAAGGRCLPVVCDIREEAQVLAAARQGAEAFDGIDILVNNASAISLTDTAQTPLKRFDLMHQVNVRGTFLASQKCLPYLEQAGNPHILNISPPLNLAAEWFAQHVAYTMSKYGMSMCVLGMAEEFRERGIAVNALWPRTAIATAAVANLLGGEQALKCCRRPDIMADAAHAILVRPSRDGTGQFWIDEDVLRNEGVTDFSSYADVDDEDLLPDFFL